MHPRFQLSSLMSLSTPYFNLVPTGTKRQSRGFRIIRVPPSTIAEQEFPFVASLLFCEGPGTAGWWRDCHLINRENFEKGMKGDLISVLGLISSAWGSSSQPRQLISYNYIACIIKLLICSLILKLSYSEPWALRSIKSWDFQVRWGFFFISLPFLRAKKHPPLK